MVDRIRRLVWRFLEFSGLDWILVIFNAASYFPTDGRPEATRRDQIKAEMKNTDKQSLNFILELLEAQSEQERRRGETTESKANQIIGFSAVSMSFVLAFTMFMPTNPGTPSLLEAIATGLYGSISISFLITILLAQRAVSVSAYQVPNPISLIELENHSTEQLTLEWAISLQSTFEYNHLVVNDKVTYLMGAKLWLRNVIFLLAILVLLLAVGSLL